MPGTFAYTKSQKITGYHGTYRCNVASIIANNFYESTNHQQWLGDGVYFFVDGISSQTPAQCAEQFALDERKKPKSKWHGETEVVVLSAEIKINDKKFVDLTVPLGKLLFNEYRDNIIQQVKKAGKVLKGALEDYIVIELMKKQIGVEIVKADRYIMLGDLREEYILSRQENVTIFAVSNPQSNIAKKSIREVSNKNVQS